jgi:uncharacterized BrkB/YihY/UPF0761 family membrane protein
MARKQHETLEDEATHILEECRMVLPGIQALFGFQLIAFFNDTFTRLTLEDRILHLAATGLTSIAIVAVLAAVAYHRQAEPHEVSEFFVAYASTLLTIGMLALAAGISIEFYLLSNLALHNFWASVGITVITFVLYVVCWFLMPRYLPLIGRQRN